MGCRQTISTGGGITVVNYMRKSGSQITVYLKNNLHTKKSDRDTRRIMLCQTLKKIL